MKFASYSLVTQIGKSPLSNTYLASSIGLTEREVVIKIFHASCLGPGYEARDFLRDAARLQQLNHPYLLPVLDADVEQQQPFVVSPHLPHGSLRNHLRTLPPPRLSVAQTLRMGIQIGQALNYCHANNLLHGHLTPDNVLFADDETVQLADFGLASLIDESISDDTLQSQGAAYRAPEQLMHLVSRKSDQFSLGCLLYELLTGTLPDVSSGSPLAPSLLAPHIPESLDATLLKALAREPMARYESVNRLVEALQAISIPDENMPSSRSHVWPLSECSSGSPRTSITRSDPPQQNRFVFPFVRESSVSYHRALFPLELEDMDGSGEPKVQPPFLGEPKAQPQMILEMPYINALEMEADTLAEPVLPSQASDGSKSSHVAVAVFKPWFRSRWSLLLLLALILLLVVVSSLSTYFFVPSGYLAWRAAPIVPAPTLTATARQQIYTQAAGGTPVLDDPLTVEDENQWQIESTGHNEDGCNFTGEAYQATISNTGHFVQCMSQTTKVSNFAYQVEMSVIAGDGGGLVFRSNANTEYRFCVHANGTYDLAGVAPEGILYQRNEAPIYTGLHQWNLLTVVAKGSDLYLYVNSQIVMHCHDSSSSSGNIGIFVIAGGSPTTLQFRNAKVWKL
ncbi:serine/threonine protein kinase [Dictyobacter aurantiacus]|uniref:non-specific serine/threonine protein kinase n=1 Tax=Dictyobacter aurantiacus TaxID=1936993 RepID=A0A401Z9I6_9CHLR|nr:serine/threonine-protein kinase [Dictyobacter aurantiacus]GCE03473.1 hypothetical protein KDAU_08020 [Dictyobacter aurantiacus]